jgi:hypothetical protein
MSQSFADAAMSLVNAPFRLHGRDQKTGMDCVGLIFEAMRISGYEPVAPNGYRMRALSVAPLLAFAEASGLCRVDCGGDIVLAQVCAVQVHLLTRVPGGHVHAHARIGRVVFVPDPLPWPAALQWRLPEIPPQTRS